MVGVPGKSKACETCKKRRVKCDESRPTCKRCEKSKIPCGGYEKRLQFVHTSSTLPLGSSRARQPPPDSIESNSHPSGSVVPLKRTSHLPPELSLVAFQPEVCLSFLMQNFIWRTYGSGWFELAAQQKVDPLSAHAMKALSNIFFGISHHQEDIQLQGCLQYGKVLKSMRGGLAGPEKVGLERLIIPILVSLMHSSYEEDPAATISHYKGLVMILQVCGPYKFQKDPVKRAFESARSSVTASFFQLREPCFLATKEWKTVPWALDPASKSQQNHLMDFLLDIPALLAEDDARIKQKELNPELDDIDVRRGILARVKSQLFQLYCWRYKWELQNPNPAYETAPPSNEAESRVIRPYLHFNSYENAAEMQLYNTAHIFLLGLVENLIPSTGSTSRFSQTIALHAADSSSVSVPVTVDATPTPLNLPHAAPSHFASAIEIVRTFEFQMQNPNSNTASNLFFMFPLGMAWEVLNEGEEYRAWMRRLLDANIHTKKYSMKNNKWFGNYHFPRSRTKAEELKSLLRHGKFAIEAVPGEEWVKTPRHGRIIEEI